MAAASSYPCAVTRLTRIATLLVLIGALAGCDQGHGSLRGLWLEVADCKRLGETKHFEPFTMELTFASVNEHLGAAVLRFSPEARLIGEADQIVIALSSATEVRQQSLSDTVTLTLRGDGQGDADLTLSLLGRCAHMTGALAAEGTLTFQDYGWRSGARVRGEMAFDLVDRRTGEIVGEGFVGDFDFEAVTGSPYTAFTPKDY